MSNNCTFLRSKPLRASTTCVYIARISEYTSRWSSSSSVLPVSANLGFRCHHLHRQSSASRRNAQIHPIKLTKLRWKRMGTQMGMQTFSGPFTYPKSQCAVSMAATRSSSFGHTILHLSFSPTCCRNIELSAKLADWHQATL